MSVAVGKRFKDVYKQAGMDRSTTYLNMPTLNNFHQDRYNEWEQRIGGGSIGKPVVDIYKYSHYSNPLKYQSSQRGMDDRNKLQNLNSIIRKVGDMNEVVNRPY